MKKGRCPFFTPPIGVGQGLLVAVIDEAHALSLIREGGIVVRLPATLLALIDVGWRADEMQDVVFLGVVEGQERKRGVNEPAVATASDRCTDDVGGVAEVPHVQHVAAGVEHIHNDIEDTRSVVLKCPPEGIPARLADDEWIPPWVGRPAARVVTRAHDPLAWVAGVGPNAVDEVSAVVSAWVADCRGNLEACILAGGHVRVEKDIQLGDIPVAGEDVFVAAPVCVDAGLCLSVVRAGGRSNAVGAARDASNGTAIVVPACRVDLEAVEKARGCECRAQGGQGKNRYHKSDHAFP